ncbi:hypothetical protein ACFL1Q_01380 [Patescibacteria group bacterium]
MKFYVRFITTWALNTLLILAFVSYYPTSYVLGNAVIPPVSAGIFAGFLLTLFCRLSKPFVKKLSTKAKGRVMMFVFYWLVNSVGIWIIARLSVISGFGIASFYKALILGAVVSLGQWALRQTFKKFKLIEK